MNDSASWPATFALNAHGGTQRRNVELKARLTSIDAARRTAENLCTDCLGIQRQVDTYFFCRRGRLKLRQIEPREAQLVWYARPDDSGPKMSNYRLVPVSDTPQLRQALAEALGVQSVVRKRREIFLFQNVRIHLDEVCDLGRFLEFEAVLGPDADEASGRTQLAMLSERFDISASDLLTHSYGDMLERRTKPHTRPELRPRADPG